MAENQQRASKEMVNKNIRNRSAEAEKQCLGERRPGQVEFTNNDHNAHYATLIFS